MLERFGIWSTQNLGSSPQVLFRPAEHLEPLELDEI